MEGLEDRQGLEVGFAGLELPLLALESATLIPGAPSAGPEELTEVGPSIYAFQ